MNIKKRLSTGFFYIFSGRLLGGILTVLITPILVRILGSGGYGDYAFAMAVYSVLRTLAGGGVYEGARKFIAETTDAREQTQIFHFYLGIALLFGSLVAVSLVVFTRVAVGPFILDYSLRQYLYIVAILVFFHAFYHLVRSSLMGFQLERYSEPMYVLNRVFFAVIGLPLAYIGYHVTGVLAGHAISTVLIVLCGSYFIARYTDISLRRLTGIPVRLRSLIDSKLFRYGLLNVVFVLLTKSLYATDIVLLQPFAGSEHVGYYRASLVVAEFLWFVPLALQIVLLHSTSHLWANNRVDDINRIAQRITRYTLLLTGFMALLLVIIGQSFLELYFGSGFATSYLPMVVLLPGVIGFAVARPIYGIGQGHGNMRVLVIATGAAALINLVLNLLLIPSFGMIGAAIATSIGYGTMLAFHIVSARYVGFDPVTHIRMIRILAACLFPIPFLFGFSMILVSPILRVFVISLAGLGLFIIGALLTRALDIQELRQAWQAIRTAG